MSIQVVFDSNIWELIVDEVKKDVSSVDIGKIHLSILEGLIKPYFFEGIVNYESIKKIDRKNYISSYKSGLVIYEDGEKVLDQKGTEPKELSEYLTKNINDALKIGFKFIHFPRIGAPRHKLSELGKAAEILPLNERLERSFACVRYIESLGCGKASLMNMLQDAQHGLINSVQQDPINEKKFSKGVAEWMDGDALAATYGYGIKFFCTYDQGIGAGKNSILHPDNRESFEREFDVKIVTPEEIIQIVMNSDKMA